MYYPYFRGKQYDLLAIRESAGLISQSAITPVIEPVRSSVSGLLRALSALKESGAGAIIIVNPMYGDFSTDTTGLDAMLGEELSAEKAITPGILLTAGSTITEIVELCEKFGAHAITFVHSGFTEAKELSGIMLEMSLSAEHIFSEEHCGKLYRKHFRNSKRILLRNGFKKQANRKYDPLEFFSDLHATYREEGADGFGDFLVVGDEYSESGGPAYAIAIHLTFIDEDRDEEMHIHHFKSIRQDSPTDPAGKFAEALEKLVTEVNRPGSKILKTEAVNEFLSLSEAKHFPGLGYVKKLSMKHHMEIIAKYMDRE